MKYVLAILGMIASYFMIKYRERIGDMFGEQEWMRYVGGVYSMVVIIAILIFFWGLATITNTQHFFLAPLLKILPGTSTPL